MVLPKHLSLVITPRKPNPDVLRRIYQMPLKPTGLVVDQDPALIGRRKGGLVHNLWIIVRVLSHFQTLFGFSCLLLQCSQRNDIMVLCAIWDINGAKPRDMFIFFL